MKRGLIIIGIIILASLLLFYTQVKESKLITIGVIADYSKGTTTASVDAFRAVELAIEELNEPTEKYKLVRFNTMGYEDQALLKSDIEDEKVDIIVGPPSSSQYFQVKDLLDELNLPVFLIAVSSNAINDKQDNLFRINGNIDSQVKAMVNMANKYLSIDDIVIYYTSNNIGYSEPFATALADRINEDGSARIVRVDDISTDTVQQELLSSNNKHVIIIAGPSYAGIIAQLITENSPETSILFPAWAKSSRTLDYTIAIENPLYMIDSLKPIETIAYEELADKFEDTKNISMNSSSFFGYEAMLFADYVINEVESVDLEDIQNFIHQTEMYKSEYYEYKFNRYGDGARGYSLVQIINGEYVLVEEIDD